MGDIVRAEKSRSPFSPGRPVPPDMFVGRGEQIKRILRSVRQVIAGKQENLFITGEYGIGKSSLVSYIRLAAEEEHKLVGFHVFLGGVSSIDGMAQQVVSRIIQQAHRNKVLDKVQGLLGKYVDSVEFFGVKLNVQALRRDAPEIAQDFLPFLRRIWSTLKGDFKGMGLYLDDLNGITKSPKFAALLKSLVDEIATSGEPFPLLLTLAGVPERRLDILTNQPSVERIFNIVELNPLEDAEVEEFFQQAFNAANMSVNEDTTGLLVYYSGGLPKLMHEVGDAVFWENEDSVVDEDDAVKGIFEAADVVGRKYFEPVSLALRSSDYHSILRKLGQLETKPSKLALSFHKSELAKGLNETERRKLDNFLQRMKKLRALYQGDVRGEWIFPNRLVRFYLLMESQRVRKKKN